jgi:FkbM family methyltransferase
MDPWKKSLLGLLRRKSMYGTNLKLHRRALAGMGVGGYGPMEETGELRFLQNLLPQLAKQPVILDIGANRGAYAAAAMRLRPDAILHAFEPHPRIYPALAAEAKRLGFTAHNLGCGAEAGHSQLFDIATGSGEGASRARDVIAAAGALPEAYPIELVSLDPFLDRLGIGAVAYMKIDVEGYELDVLRSIPRRIAHGKLGCVSFEFNVMNLVTRVFLKDFTAVLPGWSFHRLLPDGLAPMGAYDPLSWEVFGWQNIAAFPAHTSLRAI